MELHEININEYVLQLLKDKQFLSSEYRRFKDNCYFYQRQVLNRYPQTYEVFAWLFEKICQYDFFREEDMKKILCENPDITKYGVQTCIDSIHEKYGSSNKLNVAIEWVKHME